jgi:hypothetical protein
MRSFRFAKLHLAMLLALLAGTIFAPTALRAQDSSSMTGVVTDATGAAIPGVTVTLSNKLTGNSYTQTTDKLGTYRFAGVPPGEGYTATFTRTGFSKADVNNISLGVGITRTQGAQLVAGATETVEVSAGNQQVTLNTTDATIGNNISLDTLQDLPVYDRTNGISTLFVLQPGVDSNQGAVTGARIDQSEVTLDGLDVNDVAAGTTFGIVANAPVDSIQQFTGTVAGLTASVGTGSGGQFQLVTKSGTNQFHGNINEYHRDTSTEANGFFDNLDGVARPALIRNQFGGNIGGPIKKDKLFFFFDLADSRIIQSAGAEDIVPVTSFVNTTAPTLNYVNSGPNCSDASRLNTQPTCITALSQTQVTALDPAGIGFDPAVTAFLGGRFPAPNDPTAGDGVNTEGFRFTYAVPDNNITYVGRVDYNVTPKNKVFGRFTINRENVVLTQIAPTLPTDPATHLIIDRSYGYVVSDIWALSQNKVNQFYYGDNISKLNFPDVFNPPGANQYSFSGLTTPFTNFDGQQRRVPIPVVRDDFNWQVHNHSLTFGGTFKFIKATSNLISDFNNPGLGLQGGVLSPGLGANSPARPADIFTDEGATTLNNYDSAFADALGVIGTVSTIYDYNSKGVASLAGSGGPKAYRYFETEFYFGDTWKLTNKLTMSYGLRYQLYSVPYETHGEQTAMYIDGLTPQQSSLNAYFKDRTAQIAAGNDSPSGLPFFSAELGGKANNAAPYYAQNNKDLAPRVAFSYNPTPKTVINGGAGIVYDRTVIDAALFFANQNSFLFENQQVNTLNEGSSPLAAIQNDPRVATAASFPGTTGPGLSYNAALNPPPAPIALPFTPFVSGGIPNGITAIGENFVFSPNLKDPYSIALNAGIQQDLPWHMVLKVNYTGRLGRRLLAEADAGQILDFPDNTGKSSQTMVQAFAGLTTQLRAGTAPSNLAAEPWFENVLQPGIFAAVNQVDGTNFANNTQLVDGIVGQLANRGDIGDSLLSIADFGILPFNVGIPSQFAVDGYLTNLGSSNYHGLLVTLDKNMSNGLNFGLNYTWSHSIDNTSLSANNNSFSNGVGLVCDLTQLRACRGSSDFDVRQETTANILYDLPFGHGRQFGGAIPIWENEILGQWSISALPGYRTGLAVTAYADASLASLLNADPAIFTGRKSDLRSHVNVSNSTVFNFAGGQAGATKLLSEFVGPVGLQYGQRNLLNGPGAFTLDMGLAKTFPIYPSKNVNLKFRADAFNVLNHPDFGTPGGNGLGQLSIVNSPQFGQITGTSNPVGGFAGARVAQFSLRLEF